MTRYLLLAFVSLSRGCRTDKQCIGNAVGQRIAAMCTSSQGTYCAKSNSVGDASAVRKCLDIKYAGLHLLAVVQIIYLMVCLETYGYAPLGVFDKTTPVNVSSLASVSGSVMTTVTQPVNPYLGLTQERLLQACAAFTPCMRNDHVIFARYKTLQQVRNDGLCCGRCISSINTTSVRHCIYTDRSRCITLYQSTEANFAYSASCENVDTANGHAVANNFGACCLGLLGHCRMTVITECRHTLRGAWFVNQICEEVNCLGVTCGGIRSLRPDVTTPYLPASANQVYRWLFSVFLHRGVFELFCVMNIQYWLGRPIEEDNGMIRLIVVFLISGVGGQMVATTLQPYRIHAGSRSATWGFAAYYPLTFLRDWSPSSTPMIKLLNHGCFFAFMLVLDIALQVSVVGNAAGFFLGGWTILLLQKSRWTQQPNITKPAWKQLEYWLRIHGAVFAGCALIITTVCFLAQVEMPEFLSDYSPQYCGKGVKPLNNPAALVLYDEHEFDHIVSHTNHTMAMLSSSCG